MQGGAARQSRDGAGLHARRLRALAAGLTGVQLVGAESIFGARPISPDAPATTLRPRPIGPDAPTTAPGPRPSGPDALTTAPGPRPIGPDTLATVLHHRRIRPDTPATVLHHRRIGSDALAAARPDPCGGPAILSRDHPPRRVAVDGWRVTSLAPRAPSAGCPAQRPCRPRWTDRIDHLGAPDPGRPDPCPRVTAPPDPAPRSPSAAPASPLPRSQPQGRFR